MSVPAHLRLQVLPIVLTLVAVFPLGARQDLKLLGQVAARFPRTSRPETAEPAYLTPPPALLPQLSGLCVPPKSPVKTTRQIPPPKPAPSSIANTCCCETFRGQIPPPPQPPAPPQLPPPPKVDVKSCDEHFDKTLSKNPDKFSKLSEGRRFEDEWQLTSSANDYRDALDASDEWVRRCALVGYAAVNKKMDSVSWTFRWFPPLSWWEEYITSRKLVVKFGSIVAELLFGIVVCALLLRFYCSRRNAYFQLPVDLGGTAPVQYFGAEMRTALLEIGAVLAETGNRQMAGNAAFGLPGEELQAVGNALPNVAGVDVSKLITRLLSLIRYFGYQVESGLAVVDGKACAFTAIRRMGRVQAHYEFEECIPNAAPIPSAAISRLAQRLAYIVAARLVWQ